MEKKIISLLGCLDEQPYVSINGVKYPVCDIETAIVGENLAVAQMTCYILVPFDGELREEFEKLIIKYRNTKR